MDLIHEEKGSWTVKHDDGSVIRLIRNDFGQYIGLHNDEFSTMSGEVVDALLYLAKEERL